jgi:hypothetical protein
MADVSSSIASWSSLDASNNPQGTATVGGGVDDNFRTIQGAIVRGLSHKGADIASSSTTDLGAVEGKFHDITGTATISSFGTVRIGIEKWLKFSSTPTLTHNSTSLILLSGSSRTVKAGDVGLYVSEGSGNWRELVFSPASVSEFTTGDVKLSIKTVADTGWVLMNDGTIGNAASAATTRANADTEPLFTLLWNNTVNGDVAVSSGRGASAAADFAANKTIALPKALGRELAVYGTGSGLTARALGSITGAETITTAHLPASGLSIPSLSVSATFAGHSGNGGATTTALVSPNVAADTATSSVVTGSTGTGTTGVMGSGGQYLGPRLHLNVMIKL